VPAYVPSSSGSGSGSSGSGSSGSGSSVSDLSDVESEYEYDVPTDVYPYSGLDWDTSYVQDLSADLQTSLANTTAAIAEMPATLEQYYSNLLRTALGQEGFQGTIGNLANRNVLSSTVASDALANTAWESTKAVTDKAYDARLQQYKYQLELPSLYTSALDLGKIYEDPSEPYDIMADLLGAMA